MMFSTRACREVWQALQLPFSLLHHLIFGTPSIAVMIPPRSIYPVLRRLHSKTKTFQVSVVTLACSFSSTYLQSASTLLWFRWGNFKMLSMIYALPNPKCLYYLLETKQSVSIFFYLFHSAFVLCASLFSFPNQSYHSPYRSYS